MLSYAHKSCFALSYIWSHALQSLLCLSSFTQHNDLEIHLCCCMCQQCIHLYYWVVFHLWMYHILFFHSPADGHLGCFWSGETINKVSANICIQIFGWIHFISLWLITRKLVLNHMVKTTFWEIAKTYPWVIVLFYVSISFVCSCSTPSLIFCIVILFTFSHSGGYVVVVSCVDFIVVNTFHVPIGHLYIFLTYVFENIFIVFLLLHCGSSLYILDSSPESERDMIDEEKKEEGKERK